MDYLWSNIKELKFFEAASRLKETGVNNSTNNFNYPKSVFVSYGK